jgi:hypothetical protein
VQAEVEPATPCQLASFQLQDFKPVQPGAGVHEGQKEEEARVPTDPFLNAKNHLKA